MSAIAASAALAAAEKLAPIAIAALEPAVAKLLASSPIASMVPAAPSSPALVADAAVAKNLVAAVPAAGADEYAKIKRQLGQAVAVYVTSHGPQDLKSGGKDQVAWIDIAAMAKEGISREFGGSSPMIPDVIFSQMLMTGINMYIAGVGTSAVTVEG